MVKKTGWDKKSPKEKPDLTPDQKDNRKLWCEDEKIRKDYWGKDLYAVFLDEKWFYNTLHRQKIKILPTGPEEDADKVAPHIPTTRSRRYPIKVSTHCFYLLIYLGHSHIKTFYYYIYHCRQCILEL